jgi:hypothetical protein
LALVAVVRKPAGILDQAEEMTQIPRQESGISLSELVLEYQRCKTHTYVGNDIQMSQRTVRCSACEAFEIFPDAAWEKQAPLIDRWAEEHRVARHPEETEVPFSIEPNLYRDNLDT